MPLYEYQCQTCRKIWETVAKVSETSQTCPHCDASNAPRIVSRFAVGGRGDLRESTMHGCHDHFTGVEGDPGQGQAHDPGHDHSHDHGHDHHEH